MTIARIVCLPVSVLFLTQSIAGDEALQPQTPLEEQSTTDVRWATKPGITHYAPASFPNGKRMAATRKAPINEPIRFAPRPTIGRQDGLILRTLNAEEMRELILDGIEEFLLEVQPAWVQATDDTGFWAVPATTRHARIGWHDMPGVVSLVGFLLLERDRKIYADRYKRAALWKQVRDCIRYLERNKRLVSTHPVSDEVYQFVKVSISNGEVTPYYLKTGKGNPKKLSAAQVQTVMSRVRNGARRRTSFAMQNGSGARQGALKIYAAATTDVRGTEAFVREEIGEQIYWSLPQDRAVRWAGLHGRSLADIRAGLRCSLYPDGTSTEHGHFSWVYINARFASYRSLLFTSALTARSHEELPTCYQGHRHSDLAKGLLNYLRVLIRSNVSADGCVIYPSGVADMHRTFSFATQTAFDATANKNPEAAAYLTRQLQHEIWNLKRPFGHMQKLRHRLFIVRRARLILIYYMLKHWGLPEKQMSWEECQARHGGTRHLKYQDLTYHRNPYKQVQTRTSPGERAKALVCNFCPSPTREGHGMEFLRQFVYASERDEVQNFTRFQQWRLTKNGTHSSVWGDYGQGVAGVRSVGLKTRNIRRWDDGFTEILQHPADGVRRALFSLGGRTMMLIEESDRLRGKMLPMQFWVFNQDCMSRRAGHCPKVGWQIHLPDGKSIAFSDHQYAATGKPALISKATRWYSVDGRVSVALPEALPLTLGPMERCHIRDSLYFGPQKGVAGVIYSDTPAAAMPTLSNSVRTLKGLPTGWKGLTARAPEGYRVYGIARFRGNKTRHPLKVQEEQGAPVFSRPTTIRAGLATVDVRMEETLDTWSEEPRFFVHSVQGTTVVAQAHHHAMRLSAIGRDATVRVRFFCDTRTGSLTVSSNPGRDQIVDAKVLRTKGILIKLAKGQATQVKVKGTGDADQTGPFVEITAPVFHLVRRNGDHRSAEYWHPVPKGKYTFQAVAQDRSGIAKVEFYLNNGQQIGTDHEAPYECPHEIKDRFCQYVYAVAYDNAGNHRRSFDVPFGDGSTGPSLLAGSK